MLEWHEGDNPSGAVNQQERPIGMIGILRDYTPNTDDELAIVGEDIVPSAWRHAGAT
jgi:RimJ/RimL family protein N-acetyltransferase